MWIDICPDITNEIILYFNLVDIGRIRCTCKHWRDRFKLSDLMSPRELTRRERCARLRHKNDYWNLLARHVHAAQRVHPVISCSKHVTFDVVLENSYLTWCWASLSGNPNITIQHTKLYPNLPWDRFTMFIKNPNITPKDVETTADKLCYFINPVAPLDWTFASIKSGSCWDSVYKSRWVVNIVEQFPERDWDWREIARSRYLTVEFAQKHINRICSMLGNNSVVTAQLIDDNHTDNWDWVVLSNHPAITIELINKHCNKPWSWSLLTVHKNITMKMIRNHPKLPWAANWMHNPNVTLADLSDYINSLDYYTIDPQHGYAMNLIVDNPNCGWDYQRVSANSRLTVSFICNNLQQNWNWSAVSANPNITFENVMQHPNLPWDWAEIARRFQ